MPLSICALTLEVFANDTTLLKSSTWENLPHRTQSGGDLGISDRRDVRTLITFESMGLDGKRHRHKLLRCMGDNFFILFSYFMLNPPLDLPLLNRHVLYLSVFFLDSLSVYTANRVFIVMLALHCVKRYCKKKNWILRF